MEKKSILKSQKGFTLIEIIAVLVILGILAAVAIPKYMDLMDQSRQKSAQVAIAEVKARLSSQYAKNLLANVSTNTIAAIVASVSTDVGTDYSLTLSNAGLISVGTVQGVAITAVTGQWSLPTT